MSEIMQIIDDRETQKKERKRKRKKHKDRKEQRGTDAIVRE